MTTYNTLINSNLKLSQLTNNNTLTKLVAIDTSGNIKYKNLSTVSPFNQSLNTTNNVTFNTLNLTTLTGPSSIINLFTNMSEYQASLTTTTVTTTTILTISTITNSNYTVTAEVSAYCKTGTAAGNGGSFRQVKRVTNISGTLTLSTNIENLTNTSSSLNGISINITSSGSSILLQVTGLASQTIDWIALVTVIYVS